MTKWIENPLRPHGQPWPGLNTRGGRLDPGRGFLEDGSINAVINEADVLEKRKGFVRGLDERFGTVVCGLFRYTSDCGVEYLLVADDEGIKVRTPFSIPEYLGSDSLPNDDFNELDTTRWDNTDDYTVSIGALVLDSGEDKGADDFVPASRLMTWFKESVVTSYFVEIQYALEAQDTHQTVSVVIKRGVDSYLEAAVWSDSSEYKAALYLVVGGIRTTLKETSLGGASVADGFLRLSYDSSTFTATMRIVPTGGSIVSVSSEITELQDASLGQDSAVGIQRNGVFVNPEIGSVSGGTI